MRFVDNQDGTVTDTKTGLVWLKDAGHRYKLYCNEAFDWVESLSDGNWGLSDGSRPGDWQIPSKRQLLTLVDKSQRMPALPIDHPFVNVANSDYWTRDRWSEFHWEYYEIVEFASGRVDYVHIEMPENIWPVRTGPKMAKKVNIPWIPIILIWIIFCIALCFLTRVFSLMR